jgi:hypothetical protein
VASHFTLNPPAVRCRGASKSALRSAPLLAQTVTPCGLNDCSELSYTPDTANNGGQMFDIQDGGSYSLNGTLTYSGTIFNAAL